MYTKIEKGRFNTIIAIKTIIMIIYTTSFDKKFANLPLKYNCKERDLGKLEINFSSYSLCLCMLR